MRRGAREAGACDQRCGRRVCHTFSGQQIKRQINTIARGILIQIAQDIHQLQRAPKPKAKFSRVRCTENPHRHGADATCDPAAIKVQRFGISDPQAWCGIGFHPRNHRFAFLDGQREVFAR